MTQLPVKHPLTLQALWTEDASVCAQKLLQWHESPAPHAFIETLQQDLIARLHKLCPPPPPDLEACFMPFRQALEEAIRAWITLPPDPQAGFALAHLLLPIAKCPNSDWVPLLCDLLIAYRDWEGLQEKPQHWQLRLALLRVFPSPTQPNLTPYWQRLQEGDPIERHALAFGIEILTQRHSIPHLLFGLETCQSHTIRSQITDALEKVGDEDALPTLYRMRQKLAYHDWTLARQMTRAIRVIESLRAGESRKLLRASEEPPENLAELLRPDHDDTQLLSPRNPPDSGTISPLDEES